jgi:hypothetical protein
MNENEMGCTKRRNGETRTVCSFGRIGENGKIITYIDLKDLCCETVT